MENQHNDPNPEDIPSTSHRASSRHLGLRAVNSNELFRQRSQRGRSRHQNSTQNSFSVAASLAEQVTLDAQQNQSLADREAGGLECNDNKNDKDLDAAAAKIERLMQYGQLRYQLSLDTMTNLDEFEYGRIRFYAENEQLDKEDAGNENISATLMQLVNLAHNPQQNEEGTLVNEYGLVMALLQSLEEFKEGRLEANEVFYFDKMVLFQPEELDVLARGDGLLDFDIDDFNGDDEEDALDDDVQNAANVQH